MLEKRAKVQVHVKSIDSNGSGIAYVCKDKILLRNVLKDEVVDVEIEKRIKEGYVGRVKKIIKAHPNRVKVSCPYYEKCGSCHLLHIGYQAQLSLKKQMIKDMLKKSKVSHIKVEGCVGMDYPYGYRNKIIISFGRNKKDIVSGFYEEFTHRIIPISSCLLHEDYTNKLIEDLRIIIKKCRIEPFDEDSGRGFLRHILIRRGVETNQTMIVLVGSSRIFKAKNQFMKMLREKHPEINTVVLNVNPRRTSVVLGEEEHVLYGKGFIEDVLCGKRFRISSKSFYQINHEQCEKLYRKALDLLELTGKETLIDAYSGIGTIGMIASDDAKQVYSVELNRAAVKDAIGNAKLNDIRNIRFECEDAGHFMMHMAENHMHVDATIMDPAREGSDEAFLSSVVRLQPEKVIYISCNPQTQIRDLEYLKKYGYETKKLYLYDLFPNTFHVECVCLIVRK